MIGTDFASLIRFYTRTNSTTLPSTDIVLLANAIKDPMAQEIMKADEDLFGIPMTADLVVSSTSREYPMPSDILKISRIECKFNGTDWVKLSPFDLTKYKRTTDEATIITQFSNNEDDCFYDIYRKSIWIYSGTITAVTAGLSLRAIVYPADITTGTLALSTDISIDPTTTSSAIPRQFHELWARKISKRWKESREKPIPLTEAEENIDKDWKKAISSIQNADSENVITGKLPSDDRYQQ